MCTRRRPCWQLDVGGGVIILQPCTALCACALGDLDGGGGGGGGGVVRDRGLEEGSVEVDLRAWGVM